MPASERDEPMRATRCLAVVLLGMVCTVAANAQQLPRWTQQFPATNPQFGYYSATAYDTMHGQVVLFGGIDSSIFTATPAYSNQTWTWDGANWTQQSPANSPPARCCFGMAYDAAAGKVVIFGGVGPGGVFLADTWVWDGANWTQVASGPGARFHVGMTYDAARQQVVLFGGSVGTPTPLGDTWVWDGAAWTQKFPAHSPGLRSDYRLAYDIAHSQAVLFGGWNGSSLANDTWTWDGVDWTQQAPATSPSPRQDAAVAYDANLQNVVLFSGIQPTCTPVDNVTWTWDGTNWTKQTLAVSPAGRGGATAAYDARLGEVVLFGGNNCSQVFADTWDEAATFAGAFVIGDQNAAIGNTVNFWGAQWAKNNSPSTGPAPDAFKGFANSVPTSCGGNWTSRPGNSSNPPDSVPQFITVIASSTVTKSGPTISGDAPKIVIVETNPGYGGAPGHPGTGTVVAVVCGGSVNTNGGGVN
jgi:Galactose oxidase, central domain